MAEDNIYTEQELSKMADELLNAAGETELLPEPPKTKKSSRKKKLEKLYVEAGEMSTELTLLYNRYGECSLASEYVDPRILFKLQSLILTGRCATISDALNLLLTYQRNYATIQSAKSKFIEETEKRYEGKAAFFNAVRYFNLR